jgi:hypothetical protein
VFSGLEVPLVIIGFEARENIRPATLPPRGATGTGLNKSPIYFVVAVAFWESPT